VVLGVVLAVQFVEGNFLQPIIHCRTVDLHPAVILLAVVVGTSLFGILGAYLAVPITAVVFAVVVSLRSDWTAPGPDDAGSRLLNPSRVTRLVRCRAR
jgi:putative heme transporter